MGNMLFEVTPLNNGVPTTLRMASAFADSTSTQLNGYQWLPLITQQPTREITLSDDGLLDTISVSHGSIQFWMSPDFNNEAWSNYEWTGATCNIYTGNVGDPFASYTPYLLGGEVSSLSRDGINASLELLGADASLNVPLLSLEYAGTGGVEGQTTTKGKLKPRAIGRPQSVEPILLDSTKWIYQVHGYGAVSSIKVYDFAIALDAAKNKGDAADYAALAALALLPGEWATCTAQGLFRLGATPKNKISADVVMPGANTIEAAAKAMLKVAGIVDARIGDFSAFQQTWSLYQTEARSVGDAVRDLMYQAGGYLIANSNGVWQAGDYFAAKTPTSISTDGTLPLVLDVKELPAAAPVYKVSIGYDRCFGVHSDSDVSPALSDVSDATVASAAAAAAAQQTADQATSDAKAANDRLTTISSDGWLDRSDKAQVVREFQQESAQQSGLVNQGTSLNVTPQRDTLTSKFNALKSYLEGLSPAYTDFSKDTQIVQSTWLARWGDYYVAKQNLTNALAGKAATVSTWTGTTGVGKPADFATSGESILLDQDFTLTFASGLGTYWQTGSSAVTVDATGGVNGTPALRYTPNGNILDVMPANWTQCVAGDTFFVNARVYISADFNGSTGGMFATTCQNVSNTNTYPSSDIGNIAARDTWTTVSGKLTISGDVVRFKPRLSVRNDATVGYVLINNVTYQRVQKNATEGAPSGTYVGSGTGRVLAENIAGAVNTLGNAGFLDTTAPGVPAGLALASTLTDAGVTLDASWTARTETDLAGYKISLREGSGNTIEFTTTKASYQWTALKRNTAYTAQVAAYDKAGNVSSFSTAVAITTARDTVAPAVPTALAGTSAFSTTFLSWSNPTDNDLAAVEIWSATSNDSTKATLLSTEAARPSAQATFTHSGLTSGSTLYYWLKAVDTSGNKSGFSASSGGVSVKYVDITDVAPAVNQGLTKTVTALPNPTNYIGASLVLYQGVLYRYVNSAWTKAVSTADFDKKITGSLIEAKTITGDNLEVGTIKAAQIGAGEIVASKLAIGNTDNIIPDADMRELSFWVGDTPPSSMYVNDQNSGWAFRRYLGMTAPGSFDRFGKLFPVEPGATYKVKVATYIGGDMKGWFNPVIHMPNVQWFSLKTGKPMDPSVANATDGYVDTNYDNRGVEFTYTNPTGITNNLNRNWQFRFMGNMTAGYVEFMVSITRVSDVTLIADGAVTTTKIIVNSLDGDRIKVGTLDADKIKANTVLSNLVTVSGTTGNIGDAVLRASDPASRINEYTTNIQPGKITIQGGTSLNDWRDQTFIKGGALKTNSVTADKLTINSRGISAEGIDFEVKPISGGAELTWGSGGSIRYIADDGSVQSRTIDASSTYGTVKPCLVYWIVGETALRSSNSSAAVISNPNAVVMGTYTGGNIFNMNYGGTVINGERITTGTIDANRIKAGSIITGDLTVNGSGTLSTAFTTATWSGVSGTGKPADNATANGPGDALNRNSSFSLAANANGTLPGWIEEGYTGTQQLTRYVTTGGTGVGFGLLSGREAMYSEPIPAQSSDVLFYKLWLGLNSGYNGSQAAGDTAQCQAMIRYYDGANNQVAEKIIFQDANWQGGTGFRVYTGKTDAAPAGTAYARLWYVQDLSRDNASKAGMFLQYFGVSRADYGATVGAPSGTKVGNMDADSLVLDLNNITNDNVLSRAEKSQLIVEWSKIDSNRNKYDAQANALGVDSLPMRQAHQNLANMLTGISGGWSNYTVDSPIDGNNFRNTFNAYYIAETALVTAIQAKAATLANWNGVAGAGKPETYNVCAKGNSTGNNVPSNYAHGMRDASGNVFIDSYNPGLRSDSYVRSYTLMWRINASYWAIRHYDVYGNGEVKYPNPENRHGAEGMAAQINDIGFGTPVVIYTSDEPAQNRLTTSLATQMYGCGASRSVWGAASFAYRSGYVLIGQKGAGDGNGVELQCGDGQYVMGSFSIVNGVLTVGGKSIKDANDLAFSDGRSVNTLYQVEAGATVGAPNGTFIGSGATRVSVESVVGTISAITDDNIISPAEKTPLYNQFQNAVQDEAKTYARISDYVNVSKGNRYECQIKRDQMSSAKNEVINSLAGVFDDMGAATNVNGARIRNAFQAFYEKYAIAEKALQYLAAESADFDQVTGSNKPENNATRGAPSGTNIGNTLAQDVEARANDPANRINNNTTTISGGKITANTVTAEKLTINSRGISFIGLNFEWNPRDNKVYWSEGYVYFVNDAGGEAQEYIPAGNTNGAQPHLWFFWYPGAGAIGFNQANPARPGVITLASWWGGNNLNVTYGGTVINGNKITTGTVQADKLAVGTLSAITADVGTLTAGTIKNASGSTNFDVTNGRITFNNGSVMKVSGAGFGSSGQFIEWFGPVQSSLNNCTEANAVSYLKTNGSAYFGGTLSAGVTKNAVNTTSQATNANVTTGKVGSRGGTRVVVVSYNWNSNVSVNKTQQASDGTNLAASVILRRNGADIATLNASGTWSRTQAFSAEEPGSYSESIGGSLTFTDNSGGSEVEYSAFLVSRTLGPGPQNGTTAQAFSSQQISIVQTEN